MKSLKKYQFVINESFDVAFCYLQMNLDRQWRRSEARDKGFHLIDIGTVLIVIVSSSSWCVLFHWSVKVTFPLADRREALDSLLFADRLNPAPAPRWNLKFCERETFSSCVERTSWLCRSLIASSTFLYTILIRFSCSRFSHFSQFSLIAPRIAQYIERAQQDFCFHSIVCFAGELMC